MRSAGFTPYAYHQEAIGDYTYNNSQEIKFFKTTLDYNFLYESDALQGHQLQAEVRFLKRVGIATSFTHFWEAVAEGRDELSIITALGKYYRIRTQRISFWWGVGATYVAQEVDQTGFTIGLGTTYFFAKPFSIEVIYKNALFAGDNINIFDVNLKFYRGRFSAQGGFQYNQIGAIGISTPYVGLGITL